MGAALYTRMRSTANRLISNYGASLVLTSYSDGTYNPATALSSVTSASAIGIAVRTQAKSKETGGASADPRIAGKDVQLLLAASRADGSAMTAPRIGDALTFDSTNYAVLSVESWNFDGLQVGWSINAAPTALLYPNTVTILRLPIGVTLGGVGYGGHLAADESQLFTGVACNIGLRRTAGSPDPGLPADALNRTAWRILFPRPALALNSMQPRDILLDELGVRYQINEADWSLLGYNATAERLDT